jgi:hypothetical protein
LKFFPSLYNSSAWQLIFSFLIGDAFHCEYAAEGLALGNSVYWIRFDEEFSEKVEPLLLATTWSLIFHFLLMFFSNDP